MGAGALLQNRAAEVRQSSIVKREKNAADRADDHDHERRGAPNREQHEARERDGEIARRLH
jgi:hypothetical protein